MFGLILALVAHIAICLGSLTLACVIDTKFHFDAEAIRLWQNCLPLVLLVRTTSFVGFDEWLRRYRHSVWNDIVSIFATVTFGSAILGSAHWAGLLDSGPPGSVYALDWLLTVLGMGLMRATIRMDVKSVSTSDRTCSTPFGINEQITLVGVDHVESDCESAQRLSASTNKSHVQVDVHRGCGARCSTPFGINEQITHD